MFSDNFNRADGPIGANWSVLAGSAAISGNRLVGTGFWLLCTADSQSGNQQVSQIVLPNSANLNSWGAFLKVSTDQTAFYYLTLSGDFDNMTYTIRKKWPPYWDEALASASYSVTRGVSHTCVFSFVAGLLSVTIDGDLVVSASDGAPLTGSGWGICATYNQAVIDAVNTTDATVRTMEVSPDPVWVGGGLIEMACLGSGTEWTHSTPETLTLSADHGSVVYLQVVDATHINFTYLPAEYLGPITFTESLYSLSDTINSTLDSEAGGGSGTYCPFDDQFIALANRSGHAGTGELTTTSDIVILSPVMNYQDALAYLITLVRNLYPQLPPWEPSSITPDPRLDLIWDAINGGVAQPQALYSPATDQPVKLDTEQLLAALKVVTHDGDYNLATVISQLSGSGGYDLTTLLANIPSADNQPVLDALAAIRGDTTTSLYTLLQSLAGIRTIDALSLRDVLQAIDSLPKSLDGGYTLADRTANAAGFTGVLLAIGALATVEAEDAASSSGSFAGIVALAGELAAGIASVLGALESLRSLLGGGANEYRAPVWPGEAHVQWGEAIAIESNEPLIGEMHGVVVDITGCESGTRLFGYDGITCYSHVGALGFCSDQGYMEPFQALGPTKGIYTVKTMASAFACRLFRGRNVRGTIRPWKIRPS